MKLNRPINLIGLGLIAALSLSRAAAQQAQLVTDLAAKTPAFSNPANFFVSGGLLYFTGADDAGYNHLELWRSDGTGGGTFIFRDFNRGPANPVPIADLNGRLVFLATEDGVQSLWATDGSTNPVGTAKLAEGMEVQGVGSQFGANLDNIFCFSAAPSGSADFEPWRTDGTPQGTYRLADLNPGAESSSPCFFAPLDGDTLLFHAQNPGMFGLWRTDGAAGDPEFLKAISVGSCDAAAGGVQAKLGTSIVFTANGNEFGWELWISDGTVQGTVMVADMNPGPGSSNPNDLTVLGGKVFFRADDGVNGSELWMSDGTPQGTGMVRDILVGGSSSPSEITPLGQTIVFAANGPDGGELWKSDGTFAGTQLVRDIHLGPTGSSPEELTPLNGAVFFRAIQPPFGSEVWKTDGTPMGTVMVKDLVPGGFTTPLSLVTSGGKLWFITISEGDLEELWFSDGSASGTQRAPVAPDFTDINPDHITPFLNGVAFSAETAALGAEPWFSDGSPDGTRPLQDINFAGANGVGAIADTGSYALFSISQGPGNVGVWRSNGTPAGTTRLVPVGDPDFGSFGFLANFKGFSYFRASHESLGAELWRTDGTSVGTILYFDIRPGHLLSSSPGAIGAIVLGQKLLFDANNGSVGVELWSVDGSATTATLVKNINAGSAGSNPGPFKAMGGIAIFPATDFGGRELWRSDGSEPGTLRIKDINTSGDSTPGSLTQLGDAIFFAANDGFNGRELWRTDGTAVGTTLHADINPSAASSNPAELVVAGGLLFFAADDGVNGAELWATDGTPGGAHLVKDIWSGPNPSLISAMAAVGPLVYFNANDGLSGFELWKSDGTPGGTVRVADLAPGASSSFPQSIFAKPGTSEFHFEAWSGQSGRELWISDGTAPGTQLFQDIAPFGASSIPSLLTLSNGRLFFRANDSATGPELWSLDLGTAALSPFFTRNPVSQSANVGQDVTLIADAVGAAPVTFQWVHDGFDIFGQTSTVLNLDGLDVADAGSYTCRATAGNGLSTVSLAATLVVFDPTIANLASFVADTLPDTMFTGQELLAGVTMRNTSGVSWSKPQGYALGVASDPDGLLGGATMFELPDPPLVVPAVNGLHDFIVRVTAPATPGNYAIQLRMVEGAAMFFGQTAALNVEVIVRPNAAEDWELYY